MWLKLNLEGMDIWFRIQNYEPSEQEKWDYQWCKIDFSFKFGDIINYSKNSYEAMLSCEVEELIDYIENCLQDRFQEEKELEFIEPDFKFIFYPNTSLIAESGAIKSTSDIAVDIQADWKIYLWDGGLTDNYFSTTLDREDLVALRDYLKYVTGEFNMSSPQIQDLIAQGTIVKYQ